MRIAPVLLILILILLPIKAKSELSPEEFSYYEIQDGDILGRIAPQELWDSIKRINRIDERHLVVGKKIIIPKNIEVAKKFQPVPDFLEEARDLERAIFVFIDTQYFGAYEKGKLSFWGPISSGKKGKTTPNGKFQILWKSKKYRSKKYDAEMPYALNISNRGYFLHEQSLPGRPASHGCIRLLREDAKKLYRWAKVGDMVVIS